MAQPLAQVIVIAVDFDQEFAQLRLADALSVKLQAKFLKRFKIPAKAPDEQGFLVFERF